MVGALIAMKVALLRGATTGDRAAWMVTGATVAVVMVLSQSGWMLVIGLVASGVLSDGLPAGVATATRVAPPGWGMVAVEAAAEGRWLVGVAAVAGTAALAAVLIIVWVVRWASHAGRGR